MPIYVDFVKLETKRKRECVCLYVCLFSHFGVSELMLVPPIFLAWQCRACAEFAKLSEPDAINCLDEFMASDMSRIRNKAA